MRLLEGFFGSIANWCANKLTPAERIMAQTLERETRLQLYEAKMDRLKNLQLAEHHEGLALIAKATIERLEGEVK